MIGNILIIQFPKSDTSIRTISLDQTTMDILKRWQIEQKSILMLTGNRSKKQLVFPVNSTNKFMTSSQLRKNILKAQKKSKSSTDYCTWFKTHTLLITF